MTDRTEEFRSQVEALRTEIFDLSERTDITPEDDARLDAALAELPIAEENLAHSEKRAAAIEAVRTASTKPASSIPQSINVNIHTERDAFDSATLSTERGDELRGRALDVIEKHLPSYVDGDAREQATKLVEARRRDSDIIARHIVRTSSPDYVRAFEDYLDNPAAGMPRILTNGEARAAMSLTAANGGVLVPQFLDPTIILTNTGAENDVRQIASQVSITTDQWDGVTSAGVTAQWLAEATEAADATPTFVGPTITPAKAAAWLFGSYEVIADSGFNEVARLIADGKDRLEEAAFVTGNGTNQPWGLVSRLSGTGPVVAGTSGASGAANLAAGDIYALDNALGPRFRRNANWLAAKSTYNALRAVTDTRDNFWGDFGGGQPSQLLGYNTYQNESMDQTVVSGSNDYVLILGDFSNYKIVDRIGVEIMYEPMVLGSNRIPTGQAGWFAFWRVGADVLTSNAFKTLLV